MYIDEKEFIDIKDLNKKLKVQAFKASNSFYEYLGLPRIILKIEDKYCIAAITDEWTPIEIGETVRPFDEERVYPLSEIERKLVFKEN